MIALFGDADVLHICLLGRRIMPAEAPCQASLPYHTYMGRHLIEHFAKLDFWDESIKN
jgi:hypothetical protein